MDADSENHGRVIGVMPSKNPTDIEPMTISSESLSALRKLEAEATGGEWVVFNPSPDHPDDEIFHRGKTVCAPTGWMALMAVAYCDYMTPEYAEGNAAFIAALRNHAKSLIAAAEERNAWEETARQYARNMEFYRGIVELIGEQFGDAAKTSDDGSLQQSVLALKVPELVSALRARLERAEAVVEAARAYGFEDGNDMAQIRALSNALSQYDKDRT